MNAEQHEFRAGDLVVVNHHLVGLWTLARCFQCHLNLSDSVVIIEYHHEMHDWSVLTPLGIGIIDINNNNPFSDMPPFHHPYNECDYCLKKTKEEYERDKTLR